MNKNQEGLNFSWSLRKKWKPIEKNQFGKPKFNTIYGKESKENQKNEDIFEKEWK